MKHFAGIFSILTVTIFCLCGCGKNSANAPEKSAASYPLPAPPVVVSCHAGVPGGRFVINSITDPKTFNYITANEQSSIDICRLLFWSLLNLDQANQSVEPGLADFWTNSSDGKTWTFHLRKNLRWSDGAPLTADDVVFTWNDVIYNPNIDNVTRDQFIIKGKKFTISKVDELTVRVVTPAVFAPFLVDFGAGVPIMPKHILEKHVTNGTFTSAYGVNSAPADVVGSGPYRLKEYKPAQYTLLERNPYFLEVDTNGTRLPYFDDVIYAVVPDFDAQSLRFLGGESDVDDQIAPYQYDQFKAEAGKGKFTLLEPGISLMREFLVFNENTNMNPQTGQPYVEPIKLKWFRNTKFRQAVSYAINRQEIIKSVLFGHGIPAYGMESPGNKKWYDPNIQKYAYDPAKALELLKEIGIEKRNGDNFLTDSNGNKIEFVLNTLTGSPGAQKQALLIMNDLNKLGMHVVFQPIEFNTLEVKLTETYNYDCALAALGTGGSADPSSGMNVIKSSGFTHWWFPQQKNPSTPWEAQLDQLMDAQMETLNETERKTDYDKVQEILAEQQPFIFTVTPMVYAAIRPDVGNVRPAVVSDYPASWNVEELYFKK